MKLNTLTKLMKWFSISLACAATSLVGVPENITYNGSLADESGSLLDGTYYFKIVIADSAGTSPGYWNNEDGNAPDDLVPDDSIEVDVSQGIYSIVLEGVDSSVLTNPDANIWVFVSDAPDGTFEALGAAPLTSVPYAVVAGTAESIDGSAIEGEIDGSLLSDGTVNANKLGTITLDFPQLDADGIPGGDSKDVNMADMLLDIASNSQIMLDDVREVDEEGTALVFLRVDWGINNGPLPGGGEFLDPFPVLAPYETNKDLMPHLDVLDEDGNSLIGVLGTVDSGVPGLTFNRRFDDIDAPHDGGFAWEEERLSVSGVPTEVGEYTIYARATTKWGHHYLKKYIVIVREVFLAGSELTINVRDKSGAVTTDDEELDAIGGDQAWVNFQTTEPLTDDITVQWSFNGDIVGTLNGAVGQSWYINSANGDGTAPSAGVREIDEDPEGVYVNDEGDYSASILFDWGQTFAIGMVTLDEIDDGIAFDSDGGMYYDAPGTPPSDLFDLFIPGSAALGASSPFTDGQGFQYGFTPAPDDPNVEGDLTDTIEAGESDKDLYVQNVFSSAADTYVTNDMMQYQWYQQRYWWTGSQWLPAINVIQDQTITDNDVDPDIRLDLDGFGTLLPSGTTLKSIRVNDGLDVPITNVGMFAGIRSSEPTNAYPDDVANSSQRWYMADGSDFTFDTELPERLAALPNPVQERVLYWVYVNNGFIDRIVPVAAVIEVGDNINISNDLVSREQVAGYPVTIGGDFGTTNGETYPAMFPPAAQPGVNGISYWWQPDVPSEGWEFLDDSLANSIRILGPYAANNDINGDEDIGVQLTLHSGYSQETTTADVAVQSDIVVWDMYLEEIDFTTDPITVNQAATDSLFVDAGDDVRLTLQAYVRPSRIFDVGDDGLYDALGRTVTARFFLLPDFTGVPVQLTNDITFTLASDDDTDGWDALAVDTVDNGGTVNHVPNLNENSADPADPNSRELLVWEVILENPLEALAVSNEATGIIYAEITSWVGGQPVNVFTTWGPNGLIQPVGADAIDGTLDSNIELPAPMNLTVDNP